MMRKFLWPVVALACLLLAAELLDLSAVLSACAHVRPQ